MLRGLSFTGLQGNSGGDGRRSPLQALPEAQPALGSDQAAQELSTWDLVTSKAGDGTSSLGPGSTAGLSLWRKMFPP